jgi:lysophospholipase L1-like esterase
VKKRTYLAFAYLTALHLLAGALIVKVEAVPKVIERIDMADAKAQFAALLDAHPGFVLLGDSNTSQLGDAAGGANYGVSGEVAAGVQRSIPHYTRVKVATAIGLMIGTNDVWRGKAAGLPDRLRAVRDALPAAVPLVWSAIPPGNDFRLNLESVLEANRSIEALCAERPGCTFIDTWKLFADADGQPIARYFIGDGVHLSAEGYRTWLRALDKTLQPRED